MSSGPHLIDTLDQAIARIVASAGADTPEELPLTIPADHIPLLFSGFDMNPVEVQAIVEGTIAQTFAGIRAEAESGDAAGNAISVLHGTATTMLLLGLMHARRQLADGGAPREPWTPERADDAALGLALQWGDDPGEIVALATEAVMAGGIMPQGNTSTYVVVLRLHGGPAREVEVHMPQRGPVWARRTVVERQIREAIGC